MAKKQSPAETIKALERQLSHAVVERARAEAERNDRIAAAAKAETTCAEVLRDRALLAKRCDELTKRNAELERSNALLLGKLERVAEEDAMRQERAGSPRPLRYDTNEHRFGNGPVRSSDSNQRWERP